MYLVEYNHYGPMGYSFFFLGLSENGETSPRLDIKPLDPRELA